jgi:hypothetical protein
MRFSQILTTPLSHSQRALAVTLGGDFTVRLVDTPCGGAYKLERPGEKIIVPLDTLIELTMLQRTQFDQVN